jgi:hypothetical protein
MYRFKAGAATAVPSLGPKSRNFLSRGDFPIVSLSIHNRAITSFISSKACCLDNTRTLLGPRLC